MRAPAKPQARQRTLLEDVCDLTDRLCAEREDAVRRAMAAERLAAELEAENARLLQRIELLRGVAT